MRLCGPRHAVSRVAGQRQLIRSSKVQVTRDFASTTLTRYPQLVDETGSDPAPYKFKAQVNPRARNVAVVGGGITGLATAYDLTKALPNAQVTLFENKPKLGGWLESELVQVDGGEVLFEWGPRTLRNDSIGSGRYTAQLIAQLGMADDLITTPATSPAARNRYIYYPDHLVRMPGPHPDVGPLRSFMKNVTTIFREPIFKGVIGGVLHEPTVEARPTSVRDESVGSFIKRRFGQPIADNIASALLHGIYAGDLYKLSAKTIFPLLWHIESISDAGIVGEYGDQMFGGLRLLSSGDIEFGRQSDRQSKIPHDALYAVSDKLKGASVYTFKKGLQQLAQGIEASLRKNENVEINHVTAMLAFDSRTERFHLADRHDGQDEAQPTADGYDYVVAAIPPSSLSKVLSTDGVTSPQRPSDDPMGKIHHLAKSISSVNVMVVNLFYHNPNLVPVAGFGYLLPRSVPLDQNPERALGVIFGSETSRGYFDGLQDSIDGPGQDSATGTKLTVMMGGHWWNDWLDSDLPDESAGIEMAKAVLERHLGITDAPVVAKARLQRQAIPQYEVGYHEHMAKLNHHLKQGFRGKLKVAGSAYHGVGVNDCIMAAKKTAFAIGEGLDDRTGLEGFVQETEWRSYEYDTQGLFDSSADKGGKAELGKG